MTFLKIAFFRTWLYVAAVISYSYGHSILITAMVPNVDRVTGFSGACVQYTFSVSKKMVLGRPGSKTTFNFFQKIGTSLMN